MTVDLQPLFEPRGVIVTGASSHPGKFGFVTLHNLLRCGYEGKVFPIGREAGDLLGVPVLTSIDDVPAGEADLIFICTPPKLNEGFLRAAAARGVRAAFVAAGGYSEADAEGAEAERSLVALADELGIALAGPNGQGVVSPPSSMCAQIVAPYPPSGSIGVASQSGNFVSSFLNHASHNGIGISRAVSAGNAAATSVVDYLEWYANDDATAVGLAYVEGIDDGRDLYERLSSVSRRMPLVVLKGGRSASGARAAASHTGALATDDKLFDGMAAQAGVTRADGVQDAYEAAATFATQPLPRGGRVAVLTTVGGWGVMTADAIATSRELELATLSDRLFSALDEKLPPRWSKNNPIDLAGGETRDTIVEVLDLVATDDGVDAVIMLGMGIQSNQAALMRSGPFYPDNGLERIVEFHERQDRRYAEAAAETSERVAKPILIASELATTNPANAAVRAVVDSGRLCYPAAEHAVRALDRLVRYRRWHNRG